MINFYLLAICFLFLSYMLLLYFNAKHNFITYSIEKNESISYNYHEKQNECYKVLRKLIIELQEEGLSEEEKIIKFKKIKDIKVALDIIVDSYELFILNYILIKHKYSSIIKIVFNFDKYKKEIDRISSKYFENTYVEF